MQRPKPRPKDLRPVRFRREGTKRSKSDSHLIDDGAFGSPGPMRLTFRCDGRATAITAARAERAQSVR